MIRQALNPHKILLTEGDTVRLNPELPLWLDIEEFASQAIGEGRGAVLASLSSFFCFVGDHEAAEEYARQALSIFQAIGDRYHEGYALTYLAHAERILTHLEAGSLAGTDEPTCISLTCFRTLRALHDPRADEILETTHSLLQERAAGLHDEEMRRSFFENVAAHREIVAAYQERQPRQRTARLPHARPVTRSEPEVADHEPKVSHPPRQSRDSPVLHCHSEMSGSFVCRGHRR